MSPLRLNGSTSGNVSLDAPAVAGNNTLVLPGGNGSSGQYLQTNGSGALSWSTSGLPAQVLTLGTSVASTSGTAIDFTSIPSTVKRVTVMFQGISTNGTSLPTLRLGTSSGFVTSGYLGAVAHIGSSSAAYANQSSGFKLTSANNSTVTIHGHMVLATLGSNIWTLSSNTSRSDDNFTCLSSGSISLGGVLTQLRVTTENGTDTFDAGTINIMYEG